MSDKHCITCINADLSTIYVADFLGGGESFVCFVCNKCPLIGPYGDREIRRESILHDPRKKTYWIDGGQSSEYCKFHQERDDHARPEQQLMDPEIIVPEVAK